MTAKLTVDMSVAPEIAALAQAVTLLPAQSSPVQSGPAQSGPAQSGPAQSAPLRSAQPGADADGVPDAKAPAAPRLTLGRLAGRLRTTVAAPERWWGLVRFDADHPVRIAVDGDPSYAAWLLVLPPGHAGLSCDCDAVTVIAGEVTEGAGAALRPGPIRVHGQRHWLRGHGPGYTVSLHARARQTGEGAGDGTREGTREGAGAQTGKETGLEGTETAAGSKT